MNLAWKISTCVLAALMVVTGILCAIPSIRNFILNSFAPYSQVYQEQENQNKELQQAYTDNLVLLAETKTSLLNAEFKSISYQNEVTVLQTSLTNTQNNLALALNQKSSVEASLTEANKNLTKMTQELTTLRVQFDNLNNELNILLEQEQQDTMRIEALNFQIADLSNQMSSVECIVSSLSLASGTYQTQILACDAEIAQCNSTIVDYENEILSLRSQIVELQDTIRDLENLNNALNGDNSYKEFVQQVIGGTITELKASDLDGITEIRDYAFYNCNSLTSIELPDSVKVIGNYAFAYCTNLEDVVFTDNLEVVGERAFMGCRNLVSVSIPENVYVGQFAFTDSGIRYVELPSTVSNWGFCVFQNCPINEIVIAEGATIIPMGTFNGCGQIENVYLPSTIREIQNLGFSIHSSNVNIFFAGTAGQFASIVVTGNNTAFTTANVIYNYNY